MRKTHTFLRLLATSVGAWSICGAEVIAPAWIDFNEKKAANNMANSQVLDFSFAGYDFSESDIPNTDNWNRVDVTDHGARPNDGNFDDDGIRRAIRAAQDSNVRTVVYFPAGRYLVSDEANMRKPIRINKSGIVLKGAGSGSGGTEIHSDLSGEVLPAPGVEAVAGPWRFIFRPSSVDTSNITAVTRAIKRGDFRITVADARNLSVGQTINLAQQSRANIALNLPGLNLGNNWLLRDEGFTPQEKHVIEAINGNNVFLKNPVNLNYAKDEANTFVQNFTVIKDVGVEDILFTSGWGQDPEIFDHHKSAHVNSAWRAITMAHVQDAWIRRCEFKDWNANVEFFKCLSVTVKDVTYSGKQGHHLTQSRECYGVLFENNEDIVDSSGEPDFSGHHHGYGVHRYSTGNVFLNCIMNSGQSIDCHAKKPYGNLLDGIRGGTFFNSGGSNKQYPNSGPDLTFWNFTHDALESRTDYNFWELNSSVRNGHTYARPKFIGLRSPGEQLTLQNVGLNEKPGEVVYPKSLFQAQLQMRLYGSYMSASSERATRQAKDANDDDGRTLWRAARRGAGEWLMIDFGTLQSVVAVLIDEHKEQVDRYVIEQWNGSSWRSVKEGRRIGANKELRFRPVLTRRIRLRALSMRSGFTNEPVAIKTFKAEFEQDVDQFMLASVYDAESHPGNDQTISEVGNSNVGFINDGSWIRFYDFNLGERAVRLNVNAASNSPGGTIEARLGAPNGTLLGRVDISRTSGWSDYRGFRGNLNSSAKGIGDLFFVFKGNHNQGLFNLRSFSVTSRAIDGYRRAGREGETKNFSQPVDIAYGAKGVYVFRKNVTGEIRFNNATFGQDPTPGVAKTGYYRPAQ